MAISKEQYKQMKEKEMNERFDISTADIETRKFRKLCMIYKEELEGLPMKCGNKTLYFDGAGKHKIMYRIAILGPDVEKYALPKGWVVYGKENRLMRKAILEEIAKIKEAKGVKENVFKESYQKTKNEAEGRPSQEGYSEDFIKASDLI